MAPQQSTVQNRLLALLSDEDFRAIAACFEPVHLPKSYEMAAAHKPISHYYFLETGIGSVVSTTPEGFRAEVGLVGRDGVTPIAAILDSDTSVHDIVMQVAGSGHRLSADALQVLLAERPAIRTLFLRFVQTLNTQACSTALSNAVHHIEERLARWLLMCHDRVDGNEIALTHDYISVLLAVRRPSVTTALHILEGNRFIYSTRGLITIRDREGLEHFAADAYGVPEAEYARLIGRMRGS